MYLGIRNTLFKIYQYSDMVIKKIFKDVFLSDNSIAVSNISVLKFFRILVYYVLNLYIAHSKR